MTDRDHFAAAALTGYIANPAWDDADASIVAKQAYGDADAMLRERAKSYEKGDENRSFSDTNHDAAPAAKAAKEARKATDADGTGNTKPMPERKRAEVSYALTDEEREAVEASIHGDNDATVIATLRSLLARTQTVGK